MVDMKGENVGGFYSEIYLICICFNDILGMDGMYWTFFLFLLWSWAWEFLGSIERAFQSVGGLDRQRLENLGARYLLDENGNKRDYSAWIVQVFELRMSSIVE